MPPLCKGRWILPQAKDGEIVVFQKLQSPVSFAASPFTQGALSFYSEIGDWPWRTSFPPCTVTVSPVI